MKENIMTMGFTNMYDVHLPCAEHARLKNKQFWSKSKIVIHEINTAITEGRRSVDLSVDLTSESTIVQKLNSMGYAVVSVVCDSNDSGFTSRVSW